jgi:RNA polymerase sigma factor (sigma-70 family)
MTNRPFISVIRYLRRIVDPAGASGVPDAQLLERFVTRRDEAAFELLVYRHGPMVFGVCQRVLRDVHDAEDAFQATLLALARKAGSIGKWNSVSSWLYKVAYRTALRVRAQVTKRARFEKPLVHPVVVGASPDPGDDLVWRELRLVLDEELNRLPEKYRVPVVLCYLEGKTNEEAARQLQWPLGTVKTRLTKARELLCTQLARRGLTLSTGLLATALSPNTAAAGIPEVLMGTIVQAAGNGAAAGFISTRVTILTEGVLKAMFVTKLKIAAAVMLTMSIAGTGASVLSYSTWAAEQADDPPAEKPQALTPPDNEADKRRLAELEKAVRELRDRAVSAEISYKAAMERYRRLLDQLAKQKGGGQDKPPAETQPPGSQQAVAYIFDKVPITREELGEYLIARAGKDKLEALVNERIIEHACRQKGIQVTDAEVEAALDEDLKGLGVTRQVFVERVLSGYHKTLAEWKQDVLRHRLLMTKLCRERVRVSEDDIQKAFEATYGEKVECRILLWPKNAKDQAVVGYRVMQGNEEMFEALARKHPHPSLAATGGMVVTIARYGTTSPELEKAAFQLQPGELSGLIDTPEGIAVLKCVKRIPADKSRKLAAVREVLAREVLAKKIQAEIPKVFEELREQAQPKLILKP